MLVSPGRHHRLGFLLCREGRRRAVWGPCHLCPLGALRGARPTERSVNVGRMSDVNHPSWNSPEQMQPPDQRPGMELLPSPGPRHTDGTEKQGRSANGPLLELYEGPRCSHPTAGSSVSSPLSLGPGLKLPPSATRALYPVTTSHCCSLPSSYRWPSSNFPS